MPSMIAKIALICPFIHILAGATTPNDSSQQSNPVVAEIDGTKLTLSAIENKHGTPLFQARNTLYQAERKIVDEAVNDYLLERQADKEHVTVQQLLERHVNSAIPKDPSEEALRVYYEGVNAQEPYEAVRGQILQHIRETRLAKAKAEYLKTLRAEAHVSIKLGPPRMQVSLKDTPLRGPSDAPVLVVEYADYECAYCQQIQPTLDRIETEYKGKISFAYKDVPLPMHSHAQKAAEAAHCAGAQSKYWEYHDLLFKTKQLDIADLKQHARTLNLDTAAFDKCLDSGERAEIVKAQLTEGQSLQLQGTPSFFINGRFFSGGLSYDQFRNILQEELGATAGAGTQTARR